MCIEEDTLSFKAFGVGVRGKNEYSLNIDFYLPIDPDVCHGPLVNI